MAKLEMNLHGDFENLLGEITAGIMSGSVSASLEESSNFGHDNARCAVRVFERYSMLGGNRVSLSVTLFEASGELHLSAIASGGSQAMLFKVNSFGEEAFLDCIRDIVSRYR